MTEREQAISMLESAKKLGGELKTDKRTAEKLFFVPLEMERQLKDAAHHQEVFVKGVMALAEQVARRDRDLAIQLMDYFSDMSRVSTGAQADAEDEVAKALEFWIDWTRADRPAQRIA